MKKTLLLSLCALSLAACAPQPTRTADPRNDNAIKAHIATEVARACPRDLVLVRGGGYEDGMKYAKENSSPASFARIRENVQGRVEEGFCGRAKANLQANRYFNPYLRAI